MENKEEEELFRAAVEAAVERAKVDLDHVMKYPQKWSCKCPICTGRGYAIITKL